MNSIAEIRRKKRLEKFRGCANKCPKCGKKGHFGSITKFTAIKYVYLICGWCDKISKIGEVEVRK